LTKNVISSVDLESRFYAVLSKAASSGLASNPRRSKSREAKRPKGRESVRISRKDRNGVLTPSGYIMNEFTDKNEQAFLDAFRTELRDFSSYFVLHYCSLFCFTDDTTYFKDERRRRRYQEHIAVNASATLNTARDTKGDGLA
jgi:hypothetical protein